MLRLLLAGAMLCLSCVISTSQETLRGKLVGTWKLVSVESVRAGGDALPLWLGPKPVGLIMYLADGFMSVQMMRDPRPKTLPRDSSSAHPMNIEMHIWGITHTPATTPSTKEISL